tara:strand:- start:599 stop:877 length:279 start_codon:yes stop_codon:yes gene_type:complete
MIKVFFIAKIKDLNEEYKNRSTRLREMAEGMPGFISIESEEIDDVEITVSTWRSKQDVEAWAKDVTHVEAKRKHREWYHWVRGIHVETVDDK